jgi:hypothetical protein
MLACGQPFYVPKIGSDYSAPNVGAPIEHFLELQQGGRRKLAFGLKTLHLAITAANRNYGDDCRASIHCVLDRADRPRDGLAGGDVRRAKQYEDPQIDVVVQKKARGTIEASQIQPLIQLRCSDWMNRLQSYSYLESSGNLLRKLERGGPDRVRMGLHGNSSERRCERSNSPKVGQRDGAPIEEIARVVKLDSLALNIAESRENGLDLPR